MTTSNYDTVVIDYKGMIANLEEGSLNYCELSISGDIYEASFKLFETLRWAEKIENAEHIIIADISLYQQDYLQQDQRRQLYP